MKQIDIKSMIIGMLLTILAFTGGCQTKNMGDITVNSIKVLSVPSGVGGSIEFINKEGNQTAYLGTGDGGVGILQTNNAEGNETAFLGTSNEGTGMLTTFNAEGNETAFLGTDESGVGFLRTNNKYGTLVGYFGSNKEQDGVGLLLDRNENILWVKKSKK